MDLFNLKNKIAIVTGAARGNGRALAEGLAQYGAIVFALDLNFAKSDSNPKIIQKICDITKVENFKKICKEIFNEYKQIDILVNNAGITLPNKKSVYNYPKKDWDKTLKINLTAPFLLSQAIIKFMKKNKTGSIINITSLAAELGFPNNPAYAAAKGGLKMLTKSLATDWAQFGIRINNICPGYILTDMTKNSYNNEKLRKEREINMMIKRWGSSNDLVGACIFLASSASDYVIGQDIIVDGGWTVNGLPKY